MTSVMACRGGQPVLHDEQGMPAPQSAIRKVLDALATYGIKVLCLHDFDVAGLTIANTLATSNRRYQFQNELNCQCPSPCGGYVLSACRFRRSAVRCS